MPCIEVAQLANTQVAPGESGARAQDYTSARRQISTCVLDAVVNLSVCCGVRATGDCQRKNGGKRKEQERKNSNQVQPVRTIRALPCAFRDSVHNATMSARTFRLLNVEARSRTDVFFFPFESSNTRSIFGHAPGTSLRQRHSFFLVLFLGSRLLGRIREDYQFRMDTRAKSLHAPCKQLERLHTSCPALRFPKAPVTYTEDASHDPLTQCGASDNPIRGVNQRFCGIAGGVDATNGISSCCTEALRTT